MHTAYITFLQLSWAPFIRGNLAAIVYVAILLMEQCLSVCYFFFFSS